VSRASGGTPVIMLGIDTAGWSGSIALVDETQVVASFYLRPSPPFSSQLMRLVDAVFAQGRCRISDLGGGAVSLGPAGCISLRAGLTTTQRLALATRKPLIGCHRKRRCVRLSRDGSCDLLALQYL
jgi:tRNA A37 threonylcarbamoyladenosine modification protein TsaB